MSPRVGETHTCSCSLRDYPVQYFNDLSQIMIYLQLLHNHSPWISLCWSASEVQQVFGVTLPL